jgi:hypothetical protein
MNINDPTTSQILAILIQNVDAPDREKFRQDAREAANMDVFIKGLGKYKPVPR